MIELAATRFGHVLAQNAPELPPGPPLPPLVQTLRWVHDAVGVLEQAHRRYGDVFTLHNFGFPPEVMVSHPAHVREVFTGSPDALHAGEANAPFLGPILGNSSVLLLDGARHLQQRRLMLPPFHGERMRAYAEIMREIAQQTIAGWSLQRPIELLPQMQQLTLDIILRTVFGVNEAERFARLRKKLIELLGDVANPLWLIEALRIDLGPLTSYGRMMRNMQAVDALLFEEIHRRREMDDLAERSDILSMFIGARDEEGRAMSDVELRDELITLLLAGHETTATALAWAAYHVLSRPALLERLLAELDDTVGDEPLGDHHLSKLRLLDATLKETLRLTPVIPMVGRKLTEPTRIADRLLPAGAVVVPCAYLTHRRPDVWPEPERFDPERFLDKKVDPYRFYPFGGGTRRCIGAAFALFEAKIVLAEVLRSCRLELVPGYRGDIEARSITFAPRGGVPVRLLERRRTGTRRPVSQPTT